tara:strand:+ start:246 stop:848 length:603 start_codon:yes stop_codon:yes gene_type:complete
MGETMTGYQSKRAAALDEEGMYLVHQTASYADNLGKSIVALGKQTVADIEQLGIQPEREALKLALEALEGWNYLLDPKPDKKTITAIKEALAQPAQEPWCMKMNGCKTKCEDCPDEAALAQRTWEPMETAPKDGTNILLMYMHIDTQVVHNGFWIGVSDTDDESDIGWWSYDHSEVSRVKLDDWMTPTHWLPLPKLKENT